MRKLQRRYRRLSAQALKKQLAPPKKGCALTTIAAGAVLAGAILTAKGLA